LVRFGKTSIVNNFTGLKCIIMCVSPSRIYAYPKTPFDHFFGFLLPHFIIMCASSVGKGRDGWVKRANLAWCGVALVVVVMVNLCLRLLFPYHCFSLVPSETCVDRLPPIVKLLSSVTINGICWSYHPKHIGMNKIYVFKTVLAPLVLPR